MKLEIFEKLLPKKQDAVEIKEKTDEPKVRKLTWLYKVTTKARIAFSEINPFTTVFILIIISFLITLIVGIILPGIGILEPMPYATSILGGILVFSFSWTLSNHFNKNIRNRICTLNLEDGNVLCDNSKIDAYDGGEVLFLVDALGKPILNKDEDSLLRYNQQKTLFIPKNVIESFGSILRRRAKAYPDCKLQNVRMKLIDQSVMYIPKKVSEERLFKRLSITEQNVSVASEIIDQLRESVMNVIKNLRGHEAEQMKTLISQVSSMQEAFMATPSKIKAMVSEEYFRSQGGRYGRYGSRPYSPYRSFGYGGGSPMPRWNELDGTPKTLHKEDQEGEE